MPLSMKRKFPVVSAVFAGVTAAGLLTSCGAVESADNALREKIAERPGEPVTVTSTIASQDSEESTEATETVTEQAESESTESESSEETSELVQVNPEEEKAKAIDAASAKHNAGGWVIDSSYSNYDTTSELTYALMYTSELRHTRSLAFFHNGEFVGLSDRDSTTICSVTPTDDGLIAQVNDSEALAQSGEPLASLCKYQVEVQYEWDGTEVVEVG